VNGAAENPEFDWIHFPDSCNSIATCTFHPFCSHFLCSSVSANRPAFLPRGCALF